MDTMKAFAMGQRFRGDEPMVFDWIKAAEMIRDQALENVSAGLCGDWEYTGGEILRNGMPVPKDDTYVYLASTWAVPEIEIGDVRFGCYKLQSETPGWDSDTYWPEEALKILAIDVQPERPALSSNA